MRYLVTCNNVTGCGKDFPGDMDVCPHCQEPEAFAGPADISPTDYGYDIETYPNAFTCTFIHAATDKRWRFEISTRRDQSEEFIAFVLQLKACGARGIGYNNEGFDYPVVHRIVTQHLNDPREIYDIAMKLIKGSQDEKFALQIWDNDRLFEQLDLIKVWHYNKENKQTGTEPTSLKALEIAMRMNNIEDLPFPVGKVLTDDEINTLVEYNDHDVIATLHFWARSQSQIKLREGLTNTFGKNFLNASNTKIGSEILITECEKQGINFYDRVGGRRVKRQTIRPSIDLSECIFPYVKFEHPEFNRIKDFLASKTITETKGVFTGLHAEVEGLKYHFGTGGIHASVEGRIYESNDDYQIIDVDVASFYPNLAIKNKLYAEHLGVPFCHSYEGVYKTRKSYPKGSPENQAYKEALNATYGNSNNKHSVFFDSKFTMSITLNGQLLLCMLVDQLIKVPGLEMIQANTDGVTYYCPRKYIEHTRSLCRWWERKTLLELEEALYSRMFIRDVNSYIAEYEGGKLKRIGAYAYERMDENPGTREVPYGKDPSKLVVPKAAEAALVRGEDIRTFIEGHKDDYDFMCRAKAPRSNKMVMRFEEYDGAEIELPNIIRYYVSQYGGSLHKIAPPKGEPGTWKRATKVSDETYNAVMREISLGDVEIHYVPINAEWAGQGTSATGDYHYILVDGKRVVVDASGVPHDERIHTKNRSKHTTRELGICSGFKVTDCSDVRNFDRSTINYDYYVAEAEKLVKSLVKVAK